MFVLPLLAAETVGLICAFSAALNKHKTTARVLTTTPTTSTTPDINVASMPPTYTVVHPDSSVESSIVPVIPERPTKSDISKVCDYVSGCVPYVPREITYQLCRFGIDHGVRNLPKIIEFVKNFKDIKANFKTSKTLPIMAKSSPVISKVNKGSAIVAAPAAVSRRIVRKSKPITRNTKNGVVITHSEMIDPITSATSAFSVEAYRCNPGLPNIFPWLSTVAVNYEKYRFKSLVFKTSSLVATSTGGRVGIGFDYDSTDMPPGNRAEFYALTTHAEGPLWDSLTLPIKCDNTFRFTGTHTVADSKLIDLGQVLVYTDAVASAAVVGDVIVDYVVELIEPQPPMFSTYQLWTTGNMTVGELVSIDSTQHQYGLAQGATIFTTSSTVMTWTVPFGNYIIDCVVNWSTGTPSITSAAVSGCSLKQYGGVVTNQFTSVTMLKVTGSTGVFTWTASGVAWNANLTRFMVNLTRTVAIIADYNQ